MSEITMNKHTAAMLAQSLSLALRQSMEDTGPAAAIRSHPAQPADRAFFRGYKAEVSANDRDMVDMLEVKDPFNLPEKASVIMTADRESEPSEIEMLVSHVGLENRVQAGLEGIVNEEARRLKEVSKRRVRVATASTHKGMAIDFNEKRLKLDKIDNSNSWGQRLQMLGLASGNGTVAEDEFNNSYRALMNDEVRDWADR